MQRIHVIEQELPKNALGVIDRPRVKHDLLARLRRWRTPALPLPSDNDRSRRCRAVRNGSHKNGRHVAEMRTTTIVVRLAGVPRAEVGSRSDLEADLRLDSLSKVELLLALETHFQVPLPESLGHSLHTFGDVVEAVREASATNRRAGSRSAPREVTDAPQWGKVLAPKSGVDDGPWLRAGIGKRTLRGSCAA